jgi:hypothetical protein
MTRRRHHRALAEPLPQPRWKSQTRDALLAILEADTGLVLAESMYQDGLALERVLEEIGGKRGTAIEVIRELVQKATADGAGPGSIHAWSYFVRPAKAEMQRVLAA